MYLFTTNTLFVTGHSNVGIKLQNYEMVFCAFLDYKLENDKSFVEISSEVSDLLLKVKHTSKNDVLKKEVNLTLNVYCFLNCGFVNACIFGLFVVENKPDIEM